MKRLLIWLRQTLCRHDRKLVGSEVTGATCNWAGQPAREWRFNYECKKCGRLSSQGGYIIPGDRVRHPGAYNATGWPIDEAGNKLKIN